MDIDVLTKDAVGYLFQIYQHLSDCLQIHLRMSLGTDNILFALRMNFVEWLYSIVLFQKKKSFIDHLLLQTDPSNSVLIPISLRRNINCPLYHLCSLMCLKHSQTIPNVTMIPWTLGGTSMYQPFPVLGGLWHCFSHIIYHILYPLVI